MVRRATSAAAVLAAMVMTIRGGSRRRERRDADRFQRGHADPYVQEGFSFAPARIVNGNCVSASCLALNDNETTGMTYSRHARPFTLSGLSFNLLGNGTGNSLTVSGSNGTSLSFASAASRRTPITRSPSPTSSPTSARSSSRPRTAATCASTICRRPPRRSRCRPPAGCCSAASGRSARCAGESRRPPEKAAAAPTSGAGSRGRPRDRPTRLAM